MSNIAVAAKLAVEAIEIEKGEFNIKCLVARERLNQRWDLVLAADWLNGSTMQITQYLIDNIVMKFTPEELSDFNAVLIIKANEETEFSKNLKKAIGHFHGRGIPLEWDGSPVEYETKIPQARFIIPLSF